ncbi:MAG: hypothetical protein WA908_05165, partial [Pontixanthobacter sp.]
MIVSGFLFIALLILLTAENSTAGRGLQRVIVQPIVSMLLLLTAGRILVLLAVCIAVVSFAYIAGPDGTVVMAMASPE